MSGVLDYREKYPELPEDPDFLDSLLGHLRERITDQARGKLEAIEAAGKLVKTKMPKSMEQRFKSLEMTHSDPETQERAKALRAKLRA